MPDFHGSGVSADEAEQIKQGMLALGSGLSADDLTADGFAAIANTGISTHDIERAVQQWPDLLALVQRPAAEPSGTHDA